MVTTKEPKGALLTDPTLLGKIDKLFACNVGEYISLPQLVVVGDQSSGKSSVLEGLTRLSFPRDSGLCTRFATQIIFRREVHFVDREISASIIPVSGLAPDEEQKLRNWKAFDLQTLSEHGFSHMMKEVHQIMDLSESDNDGKPTFSDSVLRLEICGPEENHLSVIDVPGIFKNTTPGRTTKTDILLVRNMVLRYMQNRRSVMLTVVPACVDIATQEIIEMAREIDPNGERTLRILTKPDLVDKGAESKVIDMIENQNATGQLGWVLVRNLGQQQLDEGNVDRDVLEEQFHQSEPWNRLRSENFGIIALKNRLQEILTLIVRREFPSVRLEVTKKLKESRNAFRSLGIERETPGQQRMVLLEIVSSFQEITQLALTTNYSVRDIFDTDADVRLATLISNRNLFFAEHVTKCGHEFAFTTKTQAVERTRAEEQGSESMSESESEFESNSEETDDEVQPPTRDRVESVRSRGVQEDEDLQDILHTPVDVPAAQPGIYKWIEKIHREARGFEIGTFNYALLSTLMKKQSAKWPVLAQGYISDVIAMVHRFIQKALRAACGDSRISTNILHLLWDDLMGKYRRAISQVDFILKIEREGMPMTLNHYLNDNLQKCRQKRFQDALVSKSLDDCSHGEVVRVRDLSYQENMSNAQHTIQDIHDILQSYYKVALKRFVDNVCMQAADHFLVSGPAAPMKLFSPSWVNGFSNEKLEEIVGEEPKAKRRRRQLHKEIDELEAGRKVLT